MLKLKKQIEVGNDVPERAKMRKEFIIQAMTCPKMKQFITVSVSMTNDHDYIWLHSRDARWAIVVEIGLTGRSIALVYIHNANHIFVLRKEKFIFNIDLASVKLTRFYVSMIAAHWILEEAFQAQALVNYCARDKVRSTLEQIPDTEEVYTALLNGRIQYDEKEDAFALENPAKG